MKRQWIYFVPLLGLCSCAHRVGPDHTLPPLALSEQWSQGTTLSSSEASLSEAWWTLYQEPELDRLQSLALTSNPGLEIALQRIEQSRAAFRSTRSSLQPELSAGTSALVTQQSANNNQIRVFSPRQVEQYRLTTQMNYELDLWGRVQRSLEGARASLEARMDARDAVLLQLTGDIATQYFNLRALESEESLVSQKLEVQAGRIQVAQARYEGGLISENEVLVNRKEQARTQSELQDLQRQRELVVHQLALLCGQDSASFRISRQPGLPAQPPQVPLSSPASILRQRPDIAEAERELAARSAEIGLAEAERLPSLRLNGNFNLESLSLSDLLTPASRAFSIGPELSVPVLTGGRISAEIQKARSRHAEAAAHYREVVLTAVREVEDALTNSQGYAEQSRTQEARVETARQATRLSQARYDHGLIHQDEVLQRQLEELESRQALLQVQSASCTASVQLIKALGGGWRAG